MGDTLKSIGVVIICVLLVLAALIYTGGISAESLPFLAEKKTHISTSTPVPEDPAIEGQDMPSVIESPIQTQSQIPTPHVEGSIYPLTTPYGDEIGSAGLLPATSIAVVKKRTRKTVSYDACTVSFSLPSKNKKYSYAITAGHCGRSGQSIYSTPYNGDFSTSHFLGKISYSSHMDEETGATDWAVIRLDPHAHRPSHATKIPMSLDTYPRKQDQRVCKRGYTTGFDCGKKGEDNVRTQLKVSSLKDKEVIALMSKAYLCALPGDSGSPIFDKEGIIGVLSSTSASQDDINRHKCGSHNVAFYSPISSVVSEIERKIPDIEL